MRWMKAPIRTEWGSGMSIATVEIDKDHTIDLYVETTQIPFVLEALKKEINDSIAKKSTNHSENL